MRLGFISYCRVDSFIRRQQPTSLDVGFKKHQIQLTILILLNKIKKIMVVIFVTHI